MKLIIDISKDRYDEIMAMDWKNCRRFFDEEIRAIHDGIPQRTGRWVSYPHQKDRGCSICGHSEPYKFADKEAEIFNYCPNCGCAMKGESEQEPSCSENPNKWMAPDVLNHWIGAEVLDKIRAEIEQMPSELTADGRRMIRRVSVFRIIDKYKAESEVQDADSD